MKSNRIILAALAATALVAAGCGEKENPVITPPVINGGGNGGTTGGSDDNTVGKIGENLPSWQEGVFDVHFINTTTGESIFLVFPDGTQMLIDAAGSQVATGTVGSTTNTGIRSRWDPTKDGSYRTGKYIADYIKKVQAETKNNTIDYFMITHFHNDHFGGANGQPASSNSSTYTLQSAAEILDVFPIGKLLDRGYPDYNYPFDMATKADNASNVKNYVTAVKWHVANKGLKAEKFVAGSNSQIVPVKDASKYSFKVQNIAVNGEIWTGSGTSTTKTFPELQDIVVSNPASIQAVDKCPEENHVSAVVRFSYGKFDLYCGGDMQYDGMSSFAWKDIETPVAKAVGQVEVAKANHHGTQNTNGFGYKDKCWAMKYLNPQCWIVNSWTDGHPRQATFEGVTGLLSSSDVYITNTCSAMSSYANFSSRVKGSDGHVVVRVYNGGSNYYVYVLTDSDKKSTIKAMKGPYSSR